jgi:hypothetical protein
MTTQTHPVDHELIRAAAHVARTRCRGGNHTTAAAARAQDGRIVTAVNAHHLTGGPCAELVLVGAAAAQGVYGLDTIVAVGDRDRGLSPRAAGAVRSFPTTSPPSGSSSAKTTAYGPSWPPTCFPKAMSGPATGSTPSEPPAGRPPKTAAPGADTPRRPRPNPVRGDLRVTGHPLASSWTTTRDRLTAAVSCPAGTAETDPSEVTGPLRGHGIRDTSACEPTGPEGPLRPAAPAGGRDGGRAFQLLPAGNGVLRRPTTVCEGRLGR